MVNMDMGPQPYVCPACSVQNRTNAKYCRMCGVARQVETVPPPAPIRAMSPIVPQSTSQSLQSNAALGAIVCHSCAAEIRASDLFCLSCGARQVAQPKPKEKTCPSCNKQLPPNANFCTHCGTNVGLGGAMPQATPTFPKFEK